MIKSACGIERLQLVQLESAERLERALAVCCIVAWRLLWRAYQARAMPDVPCTEVIAHHEWQALVCQMEGRPLLPATRPSLREAVQMVARLDGFLVRTGDGESGVKTFGTASSGWTI